MKDLKSLILLPIIMILSLNLTGQDSPSKMTKEIGIQLGVSFAQVKEERFSALTKKMIMPQAALIFTRYNDKRREQWELGYTTSRIKGQSNTLQYKIIRPEITYNYQRQIKGHWVGAFFQSSTLLNLPKSNLPGYVNNPISYTINQSLGLSYSKSSQLHKTDNHVVNFDTEAKMALINYLIRPAYGHPYPDKFLQEKTFNPTKEGMGSAIAKSGKIKTVNKYQSFKVVLGINYIHKDHLKLRVQYAFDMQNNIEHHSSRWLSNDLTVGVSYVY